EFCGLDQRVEQRGDHGAAERAGAVVVLAPDHDAAKSPLGLVVVERDTRIVEEASERRPELEGVGDGRAERRARKSSDREQRVTELVDELTRFLAPEHGQAIGCLAALGLHAVEIADQLEDGGRLGMVRLGFEKLSAYMGPAGRRTHGRASLENPESDIAALRQPGRLSWLSSNQAACPGYPPWLSSLRTAVPRRGFPERASRRDRSTADSTPSSEASDPTIGRPRRS